MLVEGRTTTLVLMVVFLASIGYWIQRSLAGNPPKFIRRIPALDAIEEGIGRATEMGKAVLWSPGQAGSITGANSGDILASISIMGYIVDKCMEKGTRFVGVIQAAEDYAYVSELLLEKYKAAGKSEMFNQSDLVYAPGNAYHIGAVNAIYEKDVATTFWMGVHWASAVMVSEAGAIAGCFQSAWTSDPANTSYFVMNCDYTFISEEGYSAAAYLTREPLMLGSLAGQDIAKFIVIGIILIGSLLMTVNIPIIKNLMGA
ncbi:MAG: DUF6754 domain-containing protein [Candidatus Hodarchaeota archaeon]